MDGVEARLPRFFILKRLPLTAMRFFASILKDAQKM
jgi:hypothetical protein